MSATCTFCNQEMVKGAGCTQQTFNDFPDKIERSRMPYEGEHCHDCNVTEGQLHHPGCDMERCPRCSGQAIACDCMDETGDED